MGCKSRYSLEKLLLRDVGPTHHTWEIFFSMSLVLWKNTLIQTRSMSLFSVADSLEYSLQINCITFSFNFGDVEYGASEDHNSFGDVWNMVLVKITTALVRCGIWC